MSTINEETKQHLAKLMMDEDGKLSPVLQQSISFYQDRIENAESTSYFTIGGDPIIGYAALEIINPIPQINIISLNIYVDETGDFQKMIGDILPDILPNIPEGSDITFRVSHDTDKSPAFSFLQLISGLSDYHITAFDTYVLDKSNIDLSSLQKDLKIDQIDTSDYDISIVRNFQFSSTKELDTYLTLREKNSDISSSELKDIDLSEDDRANLKNLARTNKDGLQTITLLLKTEDVVVGFTEIRQSEIQPLILDQTETGVVTDHRNQGLGTYLKFKMLEYLYGQDIVFEKIITENDPTNISIVKLNEKLGYQKEVSIHQYNIPMDLLSEVTN